MARRTFLKTAASVAAGTVLTGQPQRAQDTSGRQSSPDPGANQDRSAISDQSSAGVELECLQEQLRSDLRRKRRLEAIHGLPGRWDAGVQHAVDFDTVEIPYDHYIVNDWPDRRAHSYDSGMAVEKLVTDGIPVPVVASYGMTSGFTPPEGLTAQMIYYEPTRPAGPLGTSWVKFSSFRPHTLRILRIPRHS